MTNKKIEKMKNIIESEFYLKALEIESTVLDSTSTFNDEEIANGEAKLLEIMHLAANEGDDRATYFIAACYRFGDWGVEIDKKRAHNMTKTLENSNIPVALYNLGADFDVGNVIKRNSKRAFSLYYRAALLGDKVACEEISKFYAVGEIVPKDLKLAKAWKKRAECDEKEISPPYRRWL